MHHFSFEGVLQQVMVWDSRGERRRIQSL